MSLFLPPAQSVGGLGRFCRRPGNADSPPSLSWDIAWYHLISRYFHFDISAKEIITIPHDDPSLYWNVTWYQDIGPKQIYNIERPPWLWLNRIEFWWFLFWETFFHSHNIFHVLHFFCHFPAVTIINLLTSLHIWIKICIWKSYHSLFGDLPKAGGGPKLDLFWPPGIVLGAFVQK